MRFKAEDENVNFPIAPPPPHWYPPQTPNGVNLGTVIHEQLLFVTHKGIYTLSDLALALLDLEKKIFFLLANFCHWGRSP